MNPSSGYELRMIFQNSPMAHYSSSPGAIYPALRKLESQKLIRGRQGVGKTSRETLTFHCTEVGTRKLFSWLRQEVTTHAVFQDLDVVLLRFSYLDLVNDLDWSIEFLTQFRRAAVECCEQIENTRKKMESFQPLHGQLALANGEQVFRSHSEWATRALASVKRERSKR